MSIKSLPERANIEQLKKQAKELLLTVQAGEVAALARVHEIEKNASITEFALHDAQRVVAREYGFTSWASLKLYVETRTVDTAEARLLDAVLEGETDVVRTLLSERPALATRSGFTAAALGNEEAVNPEIARNPAFAQAKGGTRGWEPLLYVCFGQVGGGDRERAAIARRLLAGGANANASWSHPDWSESPLPALYGATGVNNFPQLARVLLEAGANPNDCESRYHSAEHNHVECLEVLAEFDTDFSGTDKTWGNTPLYFLCGYTRPSTALKAGVKWLLEHGANPNVVSQAGGVAETALHAAVEHDWDVEMIRELCRHGADAKLKRADGRSAYSLAVRTGRDAIVQVFQENGMHSEVSEVDEFLGACMRVDELAAREKVRGNSNLVKELSEKDRGIVLTAAREGRWRAIKLQGELGFDLEIAGEDGERALHWAAWQGWADTVRVLIDHGVELSPCDKRFGGPPSGWCAHGSEACKNPQGDYAQVMELLIAAGAYVAAHTSGSPEVMAVLKKHGLSRTQKE